MSGITLLDVIVIVAYLAVIVAIGLWAMRRVKSQEDFFLAGRGFGKIVQTFASFGMATSADTAVGITTTTFTNGAAGAWSALSILFATPVYWMTAPWYRRMRLLSFGDFFAERYGSPRMALVYAVVAAIGMMGFMSLGVTAMGKTISALTPRPEARLSQAQRDESARARERLELERRDFGTLGEAERQRLDVLRLENPRATFPWINENLLIFAVCAIILLYGIAGGLRAAFLTDTIQGVFLLILSALLLPFAGAKVNAMHGGHGFLDPFRILHRQLPESAFEVLGSPTTIDFTWYYIAALCFMLTVNIAVQPQQFVTNSAARDEFTARVGFVTGNYMKRFATLMWALLALFALVLYGDVIADSDKVWGHATLDLLGPVGLGLVGLMIACLMAALMSTVDALMITVSNLLTTNVYRVLLPNFSERHYLRVGRVLGIVAVVGSALFATCFTSMLALMKFLWEFYAIFAAAFWLGMLWRPATRAAAWVSILAAMACFLFLPALVPALAPGLRAHPDLTRTTSPPTLQRTYRAAAMDVATRQAEIDAWNPDDGPAPAALTPGEPFEKTYRLPPKALFWTQGVAPGEDGVLRGKGLLNLDLLLLDALGADLAANPYALNETIRILVRLFLPFLILLFVARFTRHDDEAALDRFYVKMKTPVCPDGPEADARELALSYADPTRFNHRKVFPNTGWEFCRWTRTDALGFGAACLAALGIIALLYLLVSIGASG